MGRLEFQKLSIRNNFMFGAVMCDPENCRKLLERALDMEIAKVSVDWEKNLVYNPEYRGIRLDVLARDEAGTHYNVEMQVATQGDLPRRSRYYHSQIDMALLRTGAGYAELPPSYVIFICDFDPFGKGLYRYTFTQQCGELDLHLDDGYTTVFLNTIGSKQGNASDGLVRLLEFFHLDSGEVSQPYPTDDEYIKELQASISDVKRSREMGERYMLLEEMLREERAAGRAEGLEAGRTEGQLTGKISGMIDSVLQILKFKGFSSPEVSEQISNLADLKTLSNLFEETLDVNTKEELDQLLTQLESSL